MAPGNQPGYLQFLKGAGHFAEVERVTVLDRRGLVRLDALAIDAGRVGAVEVCDRIAAANMLDGGVNARGGVAARDVAQVYLRIDPRHVVIDAANQRLLAAQLHFLAVAEDQFAPGLIGINGRLLRGLRLDRLARGRNGLRIWRYLCLHRWLRALRRWRINRHLRRRGRRRRRSRFRCARNNCHRRLRHDGRRLRCWRHILLRLRRGRRRGRFWRGLRRSIGWCLWSSACLRNRCLRPGKRLENGRATIWTERYSRLDLRFTIWAEGLQRASAAATEGIALFIRCITIR